MLKDCKEEDFYELRSVAHDRLRPDNVPIFFWGAFMLSGIMTLVVTLSLYGPGHYVKSPLWHLADNVLLGLLAIKFIVAVLYTKTVFAYKHQKLQSVLLSGFTLIAPFDFYAACLMFCERPDVPNYLKILIFILCIGGLIYLVLSLLRGIRRARLGFFRQGGAGLYHLKLSKSHVSLPIIFGVTILTGGVVKTLSDSSVSFGPLLQIFIVIFLCAVFQFTTAFAWPEFFLVTYCKFRFESFQIPMPKSLLQKKTVRSQTVKKIGGKHLRGGRSKALSGKKNKKTGGFKR